MFAPAQKIRGFRLRDDDGTNFRMLEAESLDRVCEFDIDAEVVGVEFELVALGECLVFLDVHREGGDRRRRSELPVMVPIR